MIRTTKERTILDVADQSHRAPWWKPKPSPTALELAVLALQECRRDQLEYSDKMEYYVAVSKMLTEREQRLIDDIARMPIK